MAKRKDDIEVRLQDGPTDSTAGGGLCLLMTTALLSIPAALGVLLVKGVRR